MRNSLSKSFTFQPPYWFRHFKILQEKNLTKNAPYIFISIDNLQYNYCILLCPSPLDFIRAFAALFATIPAPLSSLIYVHITFPNVSNVYLRMTKCPLALVMCTHFPSIFIYLLFFTSSSYCIVANIDCLCVS